MTYHSNQIQALCFRWFKTHFLKNYLSKSLPRSTPILSMWLNPLLTCIHFLSLQSGLCSHSTTSPAHHQCCSTSVHRGSSVTQEHSIQLTRPTWNTLPQSPILPYPVNFLIKGFLCTINHNLPAFFALALLFLYLILHTIFLYYP